MPSNKYLQICMDSEWPAPSGAGLARLIRVVLEEFPAEWAAQTAFELAGKSRMALLISPLEIRCLRVSTLLELLQDGETINWASVFLCRSKEACESISGAEWYELALPKAEVLVRVVDTTYYYIYGPADRMERLRKKLIGEEKFGRPEELDYPE